MSRNGNGTITSLSCLFEIMISLSDDDEEGYTSEEDEEGGKGLSTHVLFAYIMSPGQEVRHCPK